MQLPLPLDAKALPAPTILRRRVRNVRLLVRPDASVELVVPFWYTPWHVQDILKAKAGWIAKKQEELLAPPAASTDHGPHPDRAFAKKFLTKRLAELSAQHQLPYSKVSIRAQRSRWGSCTAKGHISLNWKLIEQPDWVLDYVVLHELVHTVELNHSKRFWTKLRQVCPRADEAKKVLRGKRIGV